MSLFGVLPIATSGANAMQTWIDTTAGNVANMDDAVAVDQPAYAPETPVFTAEAGQSPGTPGQGVAVAKVAMGSTTGVVVDDPGSPLADAEGQVRMPDVTLSTQLTGLVQADEGYQADVAVLQRAQTAYTAGLTIGN